ncbi:MAG: polysaccharide deacetylase family protein [Deltaproteobacteria bacterium]|nr:polysaccharide deacetylase family protein [Deltaproteobacteria bacterium]
MTPRTTAVWRRLPKEWADQLHACCQRANDVSSDPTAVFFRADDIAVPGRQFQRLMEIFTRNEVPLGLAVVPAWLTPPRWQALSGMGASRPDLWCWHQHGWRHRNHEPLGKKQEFGPFRSADALRTDLDRGRRRLNAIMGAAFSPLFTPPWNRCSEITLALLQEMGYDAVSRSRSSQPPAPSGLPDHAVDVDLHTDRASSAANGWQRLISQLEKRLRQPRCGIMIHHQRMNDAAFCFLDTLLSILRQQARWHMTDMRDLPT